ncbi:hypothetical protein Tco_1452591, partial [Tanacetum coccineum]
KPLEFDFIQFVEPADATEAKNQTDRHVHQANNYYCLCKGEPQRSQLT